VQGLQSLPEHFTIVNQSVDSAIAIGRLAMQANNELGALLAWWR